MKSVVKHQKEKYGASQPLGFHQKETAGKTEVDGSCLFTANHEPSGFFKDLCGRHLFFQACQVHSLHCWHFLLHNYFDVWYLPLFQAMFLRSYFQIFFTLISSTLEFLNILGHQNFSPPFHLLHCCFCLLCRQHISHSAAELQLPADGL